MKPNTTLLLLLLVSFTSAFSAHSHIEIGKYYRIKNTMDEDQIPNNVKPGDIIYIQNTSEKTWGIKNAIDISEERITNAAIIIYLTGCADRLLTPQQAESLYTSCNLKRLLPKKYHGPFFQGKNECFTVCVHESWLEGPVEEPNPYALP